MSSLIGKYCGQQIPTYIPSHTNQLYLYFHTDSSRSESGFEIFWGSSATGCGGTLTSPDGVLTSPNYPQPYESYTECVWKIIVNAGSRIQLVFTDFELERHYQCRYDNVEVVFSKSLL